MKPSSAITILSALLLCSCASAPASASLPKATTPADASSLTDESTTPSIPSVTTGDSASSAASSKTRDGIDFKGYIDVGAGGKEAPYEVDFHFDPAYFSQDTFTADADMMLFAYGMANATNGHERSEQVFKDAGFAEHYEDASLSRPITANGIGYAIGSQDYEGQTCILISVRGLEYSGEWSSNFYSSPFEEKSDDNGDHYGFHIAALEVVRGLHAFVERYEITDPKYLFTGLSRGGAVAGLAAAMMIDGKTPSNHVYAYTFEAPAGMKAEHDKEAYDVIHNYINENDMIPMLMPASFGYVRPGEDIIISNGVTDYNTLLEEVGMAGHDINETSDFANMSIVDKDGNPITTGKGMFSLLLDIMTRELDEVDVGLGLISLHTEDEYVANAMGDIQNAMGILMGLHIEIDPRDDMLIGLKAIMALAGLQNGDCYAEEEDEYDPHSLSNLLDEVLQSKGYSPLEQMQEGDDPSLFYDQATMKASADKLQLVMLSTQVGLARHLVAHGVELEDARVAFATFLLGVMTNGLVTYRHCMDTTYALLYHIYQA